MLSVTSLFLLPSAYEISCPVQPSRAPFYLLIGCCPVHKSLNNANKYLKFIQLNFFFNIPMVNNTGKAKARKKKPKMHNEFGRTRNVPVLSTT